MSRKRELGRNANGIGSIRKITLTRNGKRYSYWQARYTAGYDSTSGKQIQRSITGNTQKEVAQKLKEVIFQIDQGTYIPPAKMSVREWFDIWLTALLGGVKKSTAYLYETNVTLYIDPILGDVRLDALKPHLVQSFYNRL